MPKDFVAFRPGKKALDVSDDLDKYKNKSARIRQAYRIALAVERGEYVKASDIPQVLVAKELTSEEVGEFKESWRRLRTNHVHVQPAPPSIPYQRVAPTSTSEEDTDDIRANMLGGFD